MNREEMTLLGFEIVAYAWEMLGLNFWKRLKRLKMVISLRMNSLVEAGSCIAEAHNSQTAMLAREASGEELPYSVTMMHGQDP